MRRKERLFTVLAYSPETLPSHRVVKLRMYIIIGKVFSYFVFFCVCCVFTVILYSSTCSFYLMNCLARKRKVEQSSIDSKAASKDSAPTNYEVFSFLYFKSKFYKTTVEVRKSTLTWIEYILLVLIYRCIDSPENDVVITMDEDMSSHY